MTEPRDNSVPQAVKEVMAELGSNHTDKALTKIQDELNKPGSQTESNKQFLTELTKQCQDQGFLPKLAVEFGKSNFKALDLNGNGNISGNELQHVLNDKKMLSTLNPFQREMASYLLANSNEISKIGMNYRGASAGITSSKLDTYASQADTKYEAFQNGQKVLRQFGTKEKFDAVDSDKDGFITPAEIDKQIDFADRALALPGLVTPEAAKALTEQKEALEHMKKNRTQIGAAADDSYWSDATLKDVQAYAAKNANPRTLEHIPTIDDKIADNSANQKGRVDMSRGEHMSEVMVKYHLDHRNELDLDGNGKVSKAELNKILDTPQWKNTLSADERRVVEAMRDRFDQISTTAGRGSSKEITLNSMAEYVRSEEKARSEETKSTAAAKYAKENFGALDSDKNGWLSQEEMDKTKDFYAKALATGLIPEASKAQVAENLAALKYLEENKKNISSAITNNDMKQADIEKFAKEKAGRLNDIFKPTDVEATKEQEKKQPAEAVAKPREADKPESPESERAKAVKPEGAATPEQPKPILEKPIVGNSLVDKPEVCKDGVCPVPKPLYPHLEAGKPKVDEPQEGPKLEGPKLEGPKPEGATQPEQPKLEGPAPQNPALEGPKPLVDPDELIEEQKPKPQPEQPEQPEEQRVRTEADLPQEPKPEELEQKAEKEKQTEARFKYTQENYADALKTAAEQNKPVVLVIAAGKDQNTIQAAADASADGKAVVVYINKDTADVKSPLGAYAASVLEKHNKANGTTDESMMTVFHVNKTADGKLHPESAKFANYGNPDAIAPLLKQQIDATIAQKAAAQAKPVEVQKPVTEVYRPAQPIQQTCTPYNACNNNVQQYQNFYSQGRRGLFRRR